MTATLSPPVTTPPEPPTASRIRSLTTTIGVPLLAVAVGLAAGGILIVLAGGDPGQAYATMLDAALGGDTQLGRLLTGMTPLVLMGLGYAIAYRTGFITIGAQGHYDVGAITATAVVLSMPLGTSWIAIPIVAVTAAAAGACIGGIAGVLKARLGVNEIISSLMLNYLVFYTLAWAVRKPLANPNGFTPESERIPDWAALATIPGTRIHIGVFVAIAAVPLVWWLMRSTRFGFASQIVGGSPSVAEANSISVARTVVTSALISGALGGIAGAIMLLGSEFRLSLAISSGIGFTAIVVALLGRRNPFGIVLAAALVSGLTLGSQAVQRTQEIPASIGTVVQAMMILTVLLANRIVERAR
ncbi:ABC transporter permease [Rhodococcus pyridinivorans]|uniref:ABC transporter permease n=1 Tax=Rhodococcus pyridinivorans TaxID=103816 RepID=UPI002078AA43|nr:ABC transporter permease [Rhodococcus pyridinivorans]USI91494.1 ABC transporter permease [Rhodococcus pyridinivorans]